MFFFINFELKYIQPLIDVDDVGYEWLAIVVARLSDDFIDSDLFLRNFHCWLNLNFRQTSFPLNRKLNCYIIFLDK